MREDLALALRRGGIHPDSLSPIQRILLTTDGTVTDMLEAYFREPMDVAPLAQDLIDSPTPIPELDVSAGHPVLRREIVLRGRISGRCVLHANSIVVTDHLEERLRTGLLEQKQPIGQLLLAAKLETFREILRCERRAADDLAHHFGLRGDAPLLSRTYVVTLQGKGIMRITERFPEYGM